MPGKAKKPATITRSTPKPLAKNLRDILKNNPECEIKFHQAETLALSLFGEQRYTPLPYFTRHGIEHCEKLEFFVNQIIWRSETFSNNEFEPSPEESMYLLSSIWLHDIGMMYQIFDDEKPENLQDETYADQIREEHEQRTVRYIQKKWDMNCTWEKNDKLLLGNICYFHRKKHPIKEFDPVTEKSHYGYKDIRLAVLAALLRLADGCHVDQSRAPLAILGLYRSVGMSVSHALHWERAQLITDIEFDHNNRQIVIVANCPQPHKYFGGSFDLRKVVDIIQRDIIKELESVQVVLLPWSNLFFLNVTIKTRILKSMEYCDKDQYFALWPYLLQDPRSSTEASAAFVQIVLFVLEVKDINWIFEIRKIIDEIRKLRPLDFMLINICVMIDAIINKQDVGEEQKKLLLKEYLISFQVTIEENCEKIIQFARELIQPGDVLFVFGYSINIEKVLREISAKIKLFVVDCYEPLVGGFLDNENNKLIDVVKETGIKSEDIQFIQLYSFPHVLSNLNNAHNKVTVLLGTHGVLENNDILCKVGSELLARAANDYGAQVVAFAEKMKFLHLIDQKDRDAITDCSKEEKCITHPEFKVKCIEPKMDTVSHDLVQILITEEGNIFLRDQANKESSSTHKTDVKEETQTDKNIA
jgi:translation initiation factor 2B subunit (eIF-2B alpha/beta/delta family)